MKIGINPEKKLLTLIEDGKEPEVHEFAEIYMSKAQLVWIVELTNGKILMLKFTKAGLNCEAECGT